MTRRTRALRLQREADALAARLAGMRRKPTRLTERLFRLRTEALRLGAEG